MSHGRGKLFKKLVRTARRKGDNALARLITDVQEGMACSHRDMHKAASLAVEHVAIELHFVAAVLRHYLTVRPGLSLNP